MSFDLLLEGLAVITAVIYVFLAAKSNRSCFVYGFVSSAFFIYICWNASLYFETIINIYYLLMSIYGWLSWSAEEEKFTALILTKRQMLFIGLTLLILTFALALVAENWTNADLPFVDAFTTVTAFAATYLLVKRYIQNWLLWIVSDGVAVFMYAFKDHWMIAGLFLIYTILAIYGYLEWKKWSHFETGDHRS